MKLRYLSISLSAALLGLVACQPDEYSLGGAAYTADDLQQGVNYTVVADQSNPNIIHLSSSVKGVTPEWILTDGATSQQASLDIKLPFAGEYSVTFGVGTEAGIVYGAPYTFTVTLNDFSMLSDPKWEYLAGGVGKTKRWVPVDKDYGVGNCTGPVMYCNPDDVMNDGSGSSNLTFEGFKPNWDPGFQDWLIPATSPYMDSYMEFGLDATKGCTLKMYRGDEDKTYDGAFSLNLDDETHPVISFNGGTFALHNVGFDEVCSNYTKDIQIVELTPYMLQLATMRTNSEGAWWLIWNFIAEDVQNGTVTIPVEEEDISAKTPTAIEDLNLAETLFQQDINGVTATLSSVTFNINADQPYGYYWWNGASEAWEASSEDDYGTKVWYPALTPIEDYALILTKNSDGTYSYEVEDTDTKGNFTIDGNTLKFDKYLSFFTDVDAFEAKEITVTKASVNDNEFYFSVANETNAFEQVTKYKFVKLNQKVVSGGTTGPVEIKVDQSKINWGFGDTGGKAVRVTIYSTWGGPTDAVNIKQLKLKKNKTMKVTFKITSGLTWNDDAKPLAMLRHNVDGLGIGTSWSDFTEGDAVEINKGGETTISLTNNTGAAADFSDGSLQIVIQTDSNYTDAHDLCEFEYDADGNPAITGEVNITIE